MASIASDVRETWNSAPQLVRRGIILYAVATLAVNLMFVYESGRAGLQESVGAGNRSDAALKRIRADSWRNVWRALWWPFTAVDGVMAHVVAATVPEEAAYSRKRTPDLSPEERGRGSTATVSPGMRNSGDFSQHVKASARAFHSAMDPATIR